MILGPGPGSSIADDSNLKRMNFKLVPGPGPGAPPTAWNEFPTFRVMEIVVRGTYYIYHIP